MQAREAGRRCSERAARAACWPTTSQLAALCLLGCCRLELIRVLLPAFLCRLPAGLKALFRVTSSSSGRRVAWQALAAAGGAALLALAVL